MNVESNLVTSTEKFSVNCFNLSGKRRCPSVNKVAINVKFKLDKYLESYKTFEC